MFMSRNKKDESQTDLPEGKIVRPEFTEIEAGLIRDLIANVMPQLIRGKSLDDLKKNVQAVEVLTEKMNKAIAEAK